MKTIAIANFKGGVAKTMTAVNVADILATDYHQRVCLVDADGQGNATKLLLPDGKYNCVTSLFDGEAICYNEVTEVSPIAGLDVIAADEGLWSLDLSILMGDGLMGTGVFADLRDSMVEDDAYDYLIFDCPPAPSIAFVNAIAAADVIIIPIKVDGFAADGMARLVSQIEGVRKIHPSIRIGGGLVTVYYKGDATAQGVAYVRQHAPITIYDTQIRRSPKVDDTTWARETLRTWSPNCAAAADYKKFVAEFLEREAALNG
ncbi:MAG: ParA family protein [Oscillospiraceae bacterium]